MNLNPIENLSSVTKNHITWEAIRYVAGSIPQTEKETHLSCSADYRLLKITVDYRERNFFNEDNFEK